MLRFWRLVRLMSTLLNEKNKELDVILEDWQKDQQVRNMAVSGRRGAAVRCKVLQAFDSAADVETCGIGVCAC